MFLGLHLLVKKFSTNKVIRTSTVKVVDMFSGPEECKFCLLRSYAPMMERETQKLGFHG